MCDNCYGIQQPHLASEDKKYSTAVSLPTGLNVDVMLDDGSADDWNVPQRSATQFHALFTVYIGLHW